MSSAVYLLTAPLGMTMLSVQIIEPSVGATQTSSSAPDEARSPDQVIAAQTFLDAKSWRYSLPVNRKPFSARGLMSSWTACMSSTLVFCGSALLPSLSSPRPNVSRFSVRNVTRSGGSAQRSTSDLGSGLLFFLRVVLL